MSPTVVARLILKVNVLVVLITGGLSALTIFPYQLHMNQLANNIAIDVANRNYTVKDDVSSMIGHLNADDEDVESNTFTLLTFKESKIKGQVKSSDVNQDSLGNDVKSGGITAYTAELKKDGNSMVLRNGGSDTVALNVDVLEGTRAGRSLIVDYSLGEFDPLNDVDAMIDGMKGNNINGNGVLVNRGVPFKVELASRFKLTMGGFGFRFNFAIPVKGTAVGVTTQYYQYD